MSKKSQEIAEHYAGLQTYELLERYLSGNITDEARIIALAEFQKRGVDPTDPNVLAKAQAEAELAAYERKRNASPEEISQQETGKLVVTILMVAVIPAIGWLL